MNDIHSIDIDQLKTEHATFMEKCSGSSTKLDADQHLLRTKTYARIKYVLSIMVNIGAIDQYRQDESWHGDEEARIYRLIKNGFHSTVSLATDGHAVVLFSDEKDIFLGAIAPSESRIHNVDAEDFSWPGFAKHVLDYIQHTVYHSKEAYRMHIFKVL